MYLRESRMKLLKIKNVIITTIGIFQIAVSVAVMVNLISVYWGDIETILYARATPESIAWIIIGTILLALAGKSRNNIGDANFYSSYFEGDLDGYVTYHDLAEVTGKSKQKVKKQLTSFRKLYMKNYELREINRMEQVVLNSKKYICECKNCGAPIEKRMYFTGVCGYCGSSDLFAKVMTDNRFYSINSTVSAGVKRPDYYAASNLHRKRTLFIFYLALGMGVVFLAMFGILESIERYNNKEYLTELLLSGKSYSSFELLKKDIAENMIWTVVLILALIPVIYHSIKKIKFVNVADACAKYFANNKGPFVDAEDLSHISNHNNKKYAMRAVRGALRSRYLINSTLEMHDNVLKVALAKTIVKDKCPSCNAPIVGAVDEHYKCKYCNNMIMSVVQKK